MNVWNKPWVSGWTIARRSWNERRRPLSMYAAILALSRRHREFSRRGKIRAQPWSNGAKLRSLRNSHAQLRHQDSRRLHKVFLKSNVDWAAVKNCGWMVSCLVSKRKCQTSIVSYCCQGRWLHHLISGVSYFHVYGCRLVLGEMRQP